MTNGCKPMSKEKNPFSKCEKLGFEHLWEDTTPNIVYATMPPQYPPKQRKCINCHKKQVEIIIQREIREWHNDLQKPLVMTKGINSDWSKTGGATDE